MRTQATPSLYWLASTAHVDEVGAARKAFIARMVGAWRMARDACGCQRIQQTCLRLFTRIVGENEHLLAGSSPIIMLSWDSSSATFPRLPKMAGS